MSFAYNKLMQQHVLNVFAIIIPNIDITENDLGPSNCDIDNYVTPTIEISKRQNSLQVFNLRGVLVNIST